MKGSLRRNLLLLSGCLFVVLYPFLAFAQGPEDEVPLKGTVEDKCGGGKRELTLAPGKYQLSVQVIGGVKSCPVLVHPTEEIPGLSLTPMTVRTNRALDFEVPNDGKPHKLVLECGTPDHDQKGCNYKYSVTAVTTGPHPAGNPHPVVPPTPVVTPPNPPADPGPLAGAPNAKLCKENHQEKTIHKAEGIFILTVYHDSKCPVKVTDGLNLTLEPGQTRIIARSNVTGDERITISCGDSETEYCRYKDQELAGVSGAGGIIQEPVNTSCKDGTTVLETDAAGFYFLDVSTDSKSDCPAEVKVSGASVFQDEPNPVQPGTASQFGFTVNTGGQATIEISCGSDPDKKCIYTYKLFNAKRKTPKPPKLPAK